MLDLSEATYANSSEMFVDPTFSSDFCKGLNDLRNAGKFFDIIIVVQDLSIPCHKVVLAAASTYFRTMFTGCMKESLLDKVTMHDVEPSILHALINYCYTGSVIITEENVIPLLQSSEMFQFHHVVEACCRFMVKHLHPSNCIGIWNYAISMSFKQLARDTLNFTIRCIVDVADRGDLFNLTADQMSHILASPDLFVDKEESAYELLLTWFRADVTSRKDSFCKLLAHIRLPFIRRIYMLSKIETNPHIRASPSSQLLIKETKLFHSCMLNNHDQMSIWLQPRPSTGIGELFICVGGCDENCDSAATVRSYNAVNGTWRTLAKWEGNLSGGYSMVGLGNDLYVTGGSDGATVFNTLWRYRSQLNEWQELAPMLRARDYHASAAVNSLIFVVGSEGCECYDFMLNKWSVISSMCLQVTNCSVCSCNGKLYCVGSIIDTNNIVLQMYTPEKDQWEILSLEFPSDLMFVPQISSLKGMIYFIREESKQVLTLDPERLCWVGTTSDMLMIHLGGSVSVYDGKLVVSGGYDETVTSTVNRLSGVEETQTAYKLTGAVESYDPSTNAWSMIGCIPQPVFWHKCSSVYRYVAPPSGQSFAADPSLHDFSDELPRQQRRASSQEAAKA